MIRKIALVSDWYYPRVGGIEYAIDATARYLVAMGLEVDILTRHYVEDEQVTTLGAINIHRFAANRISEHLIAPSTYRALQVRLIPENYDIVHAHGMDSPMAMCALKIAQHNHVPCIMTAHSQIGQDLIKKPLQWFAHHFVQHAGAMIAVSSIVVNETREIYRGPIYRIPNGLDEVSSFGNFQPVNIIPQNRLVIATVTRLTQRKGLLVYIKLALQLLKKRNDLFFLIIGDGPLRTHLETLVQQSGYSAHFHFTGNVSRSTVYHLLRQAQIFTLPSQREAFGISVVEALAHRLPVVAMHNTGVQDIIMQGKNGYLAYGYQEFTNYIEQLADSSSLREYFAATSVEGLQQFRWPAIVQQIYQVYIDVINHYEKNRLFS